MKRTLRTLLQIPVAFVWLAGCGGGDQIGGGDARPDARPDVASDVATDVATDVAADTAPDVSPRDGGCTSDLQCDDGDACTTNLCDTSNGECGFRRIAGCCTTDAQCDDANPCTRDTCDTTTNRCAHVPTAGCCTVDTDCNDGDPCTRDACDVATNRCAATPIAGCCTDGATRECYSGPAGTDGVGLCRRGVQTCASNTFEGQPCVGEVVPASSEVCDAAREDEDCDGMRNEGCTCSGSETRACYTGPAGTQGVGICRGGMQTCSSGAFGACMGEITPRAEVCGNGVDEDCDGADRPCPPPNDDRASAIDITLGHAEVSVRGTTVGATHDGPSVTCACTSGANVWYRFTLATDAAVYLDTSSTTDTLDTSLFLTDASGVPLPAQPVNGQANEGLCNDDSGCGGIAGWGSGLQSRTWGFLRARTTYYVAVGGCGTGTFTLRVQQIPVTEGSFFYQDRISGEGSDQTFLIGSNAHSGTCGGRISGEDVRWFVTCGAPQFFSVCEGDGGAYLSRRSSSETTRWDPVLYTHSGVTGIESICSDTGAAGIDCRGRIGDSLATSTTFDTVQGGARLNMVPATRGVNAILVDERARGSGMDYRLRWRIRDR